MNNYTYPVSQLLTYGECYWAGQDVQQWPNYLQLGLTQEHIPELIQMALDEELNWADSESTEVWAPVHAWRTLGQLQAEAAIKPLMNLFHEWEDHDWANEELPLVYGLIGIKAIPVLTEYLANQSYDFSPRIQAAYSLERIGNTYPQARIASILALSRQLEQFAHNDPELNGFLITYLVDLKAIESLPLIKQVYEQDYVDCTITGDLEDVEIYLGLRDKRTAPPTYSLADKYSLTSLFEETLAHNKQPQVGRNDPCPCGSGKKYKKCCLPRFVWKGQNW